MIRTQIQLTEEQARRLRAKARDGGVSLAEIIRRYLDRQLKLERPNRAELYGRAARLVGRFRVDTHDLASEHDRYLEEAFD
ncbi:MAG: CopG family transcriptional regulator [Acidobacteriota bacterium]